MGGRVALNARWRHTAGATPHVEDVAGAAFALSVPSASWCSRSLRATVFSERHGRSVVEWPAGRRVARHGRRLACTVGPGRPRCRRSVASEMDGVGGGARPSDENSRNPMTSTRAGHVAQAIGPGGRAGRPAPLVGGRLKRRGRSAVRSAREVRVGLGVWGASDRGTGGRGGWGHGGWEGKAGGGGGRVQGRQKGGGRELRWEVWVGWGGRRGVGGGGRPELGTMRSVRPSPAVGSGARSARTVGSAERNGQPAEGRMEPRGPKWAEDGPGIRWPPLRARGRQEEASPTCTAPCASPPGSTRGTTLAMARIVALAMHNHAALAQLCAPC